MGLSISFVVNLVKFTRSGCTCTLYVGPCMQSNKLVKLHVACGTDTCTTKRSNRIGRRNKMMALLQLDKHN